MAASRLTRRSGLLALAVAGGVAGLAALADAAECAAPRVLANTAIGMRYCVSPAFDATVAAQAQKIRADVQAQRRAGKLVVYASTPISPRGGGDEAVNLEIAASVKARLEKELGDARLQRDVADRPERKAAFVRYYALRASSAYSKGAHDEWNIFVKINRQRTLGEQIAMFFDGRPASPAEMEVEVSPGYEHR